MSGLTARHPPDGVRIAAARLVRALSPDLLDGFCRGIASAIPLGADPLLEELRAVRDLLTGATPAARQHIEEQTRIFSTLTSVALDDERKRLTGSGLLLVRLQLDVEGVRAILSDGVHGAELSEQRTRLAVIWAENWRLLKERGGLARPPWGRWDGYVRYPLLCAAHDAAAVKAILRRENASSAVHGFRRWLQGQGFHESLIQIAKGVGSRLGTDDVHVAAVDQESRELIKRARDVLRKGHESATRS